MTYQTLLLNQSDKTLTVTLNRPEVRNAFNDELIADLTIVFKKEVDGCRVVLLKGAGPAFSAGGDLKWMEKSAQTSSAQNRRETKAFSDLLQLMNRLPCPLVGKIHGAALGGGMGLVAVCDIVIASKETLFGFTEVRLGLIPAIIGPFAVAKIGESRARSLFLSGERFEAKQACEIGLVHKVAENEADLEAAVQATLRHILEASPNALRTAKKFLADLKKLPLARQHNLAAKTLVSLRTSKEGKEGIRAFLEKRKPDWNKF